MRPHRPVELDSFNRNFFSSNKEKDATKVFTSININESDGQIMKKKKAKKKNAGKNIEKKTAVTEMTDELEEAKTAEEEGAAEDLPEDNAPSENTEGEIYAEQSEDTENDASEADGEAEPKPVSESEALESFPDVEVDPKKFDLADGELPDEEKSSSQQLKEHRERAKQELKDEKVRLKAQKKLEQKVQRPFRIRRNIGFLISLLIIIGVIWSAFVVILFSAGSTPGKTFDIKDYSICYVDGENLKSNVMKDVLVLVKHERILKSGDILFNCENEYRIESIIAIGPVSCAVMTDKKVTTVENENIVGDVIFKLGKISPIYKIFNSNIFTTVLGILLYFAVIIILFGPIVRRLNKKIKKYREDYQLVR